MWNLTPSNLYIYNKIEVWRGQKKKSILFVGRKSTIREQGRSVVERRTCNTKTRPCNLKNFFLVVKNLIFTEKILFLFYFIFFFYFCSKHRIWAHVRPKAVLTSTHNLCFGSKLEKNRFTSAYNSFTV